MNEPLTAPQKTVTTFKRKEKKYHLTKETYEAFRQRLEPFMAVDEYGLSTVISLYYDDDAFSLIHRSIEKPRYKEKFRLRSYGVPKEDSEVFAEIKKKYNGVVYKRRVSGTLSQMRAFLEEGTPLPGNPQIQKEIRWMLQRYKLKPKLLIACERIALYGREDPSLRITFDMDLRYRTTDLSLQAGAHGEPFMPEDFRLCEIKFPGSAPLWLVEIMNELKIYPGSFSKVGTAFAKKVFPALTEKPPAG